MNHNTRKPTRWPLLVPCAAALLLGGCDAETAGEQISFSSAVMGGTSGGGAPTAAFTTHAGWTVTLTRAHAAVGPIYFYEGAPQAGLLRRLLGIREAHACPTHAQYDKGVTLGEVLEQHAVDLLASKPTDTGELIGVAGTCRAVELHLHPVGKITAGSAAGSFSPLGGETVRLEGRAEKGGQTVEFSLGLTLPEEGTLQIVESIEASVPLKDRAEKPGSLVVRPLLDQWLASVDFSALTDRNGEVYQLTEHSSPWQALLRGVRLRYGYKVEWR